MGKNSRFSAKDLEEAVSRPTAYSIVDRAKKDGFLQDVVKDWENVRGRARKMYRTGSLRTWIIEKDKITPPIKKKVLGKLNELENEEG